MSYSNGSIKTEYIDPVSFVPNQRCSFELGSVKMAYLPNIRLLNLGCENNDGIHAYNKGLGAIGLIKNVRLMDARTELSAMRNVSPYVLFKNMLNMNDENKSIDSYLKRNALGYEINGINNKVENIYSSGASNTPASGATESAYLDLRELLPLLGRIPLLPTKVFQNLRLEIEFNANPTQQVIYKTDTPLTMLRPVLAVDYVDDERVVAPMMGVLMKGVQWDEIEWDNFLIPAKDTTAFAAGDTDTQTVNNQSLGFRGKTINRLLIAKTAVNLDTEVFNNAVLGFGAPASSQAFLNEKFQIRLNGKNVFPGAGGIVGANQMLGTLVDAYGDHQAYPGSNLYKWNKAGDINADVNFRGQSAWDCCEIGARVADLQLSITRTIHKDTDTRHPTTDSTQVNMYAEVNKVMRFDGGNYSIIYA